VPEGWSGKLKLKGDYAHARFRPGAACQYSLASMRWYTDRDRRREPVTGAVKADKSGGLTIPFAPDAPGEWVLTITGEDTGVRALPVLGLFVVERARRKLRPYIGDLHAHSTGSDGRQEPAYCGIRARELGYDFFALTDHNNFASSEEMIRKLRRRLGRKMLLMRGEELHAPPAPFHHVGIGHSESVEALRTRRKAQHRREIEAIKKELRVRRTVDRLDETAYAEGLWKLRKTRELGGLTLFAHPYWSYRNTLCTDEAEREQTFLDREFDAVEVTTTADATSLMANRLAKEAAGGRPLSVVGISDSHNWSADGTAGRHWTYMLAEELTQDALFDAIRSGRSLACEDVNGRLQFGGPFELVDYAIFYHRKLLPVKRRVMRLEAQLAFSALRRGPSDRELIAKLDRELERIEKKLFA